MKQLLSAHTNKSLPPRTPWQRWPWTRFVLVGSATASSCSKIICQQCFTTITYLKINQPWPRWAGSTFAAQSRCWALIWQLHRAEKTSVLYLTPGKDVIYIYVYGLAHSAPNTVRCLKLLAVFGSICSISFCCLLMRLKKPKFKMNEIGSRIENRKRDIERLASLVR